MQAHIAPFKNILPRIGRDVFVAPNAAIIGDVEIGDDSSIWYNCVLRGDVNNIKIGKRTNIQDGTVIHVATHGQGTYIGDGVTVGHMALLHACTIESNAFIGMMACVMDNAYVEEGAMVAAGALITPRTRVLKGQIWAGNPGRFMREMTEKEKQNIPWTAQHYVDLARNYLPK